MRQKRIRILKSLCVIVMAVCLIKIGQTYVLSVRHVARQDELRNMLEYADGEQEQENVLSGTEQNLRGTERGQSDGETLSYNDVGQRTDGGEEQAGGFAKSDEETKREEERQQKLCGSGIPGEEGGHPILGKYKSLYMENGDLAGWLTVEGTKIDYPVMQCEDDEYYLHHDFDGKDSKYGCLYVREKADLEEGTNFVIYGHNMRDGSMFGELDLYLEEEFYREHSRISFDTLYEEHTYEILAVFRSRIYGEKDDVFKYYQFYEAETKEEFDDFYENIKELSLYDTGVTARFGDKLITLSTCAYHVKDGRLAVVAKRIE